MSELWKNIEGYENIYQVSELGRVKRLAGVGCLSERLLKPIKDKDGYLKVFLYKSGKRKFLFIHRLVAQAFIPNTNNFPEVNHKNEDKSNNKPNNLEWCTSKYNINYGHHNDSSAKSRWKPIVSIYNDNTYEEFDSISEASEMLSLDIRNISKVLRGRNHTTSGIRFEYLNDFLLSERV